jgi:hypothetical protein
MQNMSRFMKWKVMGRTCSSEGRHHTSCAVGDVVRTVQHCQKSVSLLSVHITFQCVSQCYRPLRAFLSLYISVIYVTLYPGKEPRYPLLDPRSGLDDEETTLLLPGLELRPLGRQDRSQSLYQLCYSGFCFI